MPLQNIRSSTAHKRPVATSLADGQVSINYNTGSPGLFFKDTDNALVKVGPVHIGTTAPNVSPAGSSGNSKGEDWLDTSSSNPVLKIWNGSSWVVPQPFASGTAITTADTGTVTSTMIADATIVNGDISASAAIAHSKLASATAGQLLMGNASNIVTATSVTGDVTINSSGVTAIGSGVIVDADINASAAIAYSKLASLAAGNIIVGSVSNVPTSTSVSGDVTINSSGVTAIGTGVIVNADVNASAAIAHSKLASITAGQVLLGNASNVPTATALSGDVTINSSGVTAIGSGVIVNADISASAEVAVSKLANGTARQLLQTAANGTDVEWASNIDLPGTLDVTGVATFDSDVNCAGTGAITVPDGTTAQRPGSPSAGMLRLNTTTNQFEGYSSSAWQPLSFVNSGPLAGFRNAIINGDFNVWVRGTSFTGVEYGPDRWFLGRTGTTRTTTRQAFTLGQTDVPGEPEFFCRHVVTSVAGASNFAVMAQRIENVRSFAGQQVTLSFWAKADGSKPIAVEFAQNFGTGGSPSAEVTALGVTKPTLSTSWQLLTVTVTLPSIAGKTLGSDNNSYLAIGVWMDAGSSFNARTSTLGQQSGTFDFSRFQLEPGSAATPFEGRPLGAEISLCERFYQEGTAVNWSYGLALNAVGNSFEFRTAMRAVPEIVLSGGAETNISSVGVIEKLPGNIGFSARGVPSANGATYWQRKYTADAELY